LVDREIGCEKSVSRALRVARGVGQLFGFCTAGDGLNGPGAPEVGQGPVFVAAKQGMAGVAEVVAQGVAGATVAEDIRLAVGSTPRRAMSAWSAAMICMTRFVAEPDPAYLRSAVRDAGTNIPLAVDKGIRRTKPFLETAVQAIHHRGSSTWIRQHWSGVLEV
jgi:hypothetical protein